MTDDKQKIQKIISYCNDKWVESDRSQASAWPTPDMQTGKKMAYNDVLQFAHKLFNERGHFRSGTLLYAKADVLSSLNGSILGRCSKGTGKLAKTRPKIVHLLRSVSVFP